MNAIGRWQGKVTSACFGCLIERWVAGVNDNLNHFQMMNLLVLSIHLEPLLIALLMYITYVQIIFRALLRHSRSQSLI